MTAAEILPYVAAALSVGSVGFVSIGVPVIGYWVKSQDKRAHSLGVRCGTLEQGAAAHAVEIAGMKEGMERIERKLDRVLERLPYRPEMGSVHDG